MTTSLPFGLRQARPALSAGTRHAARRRLVLACCGLLLILGPGCGRGRSGYERYVPSADAARHALEQALADWRQGQPPRRIETGSPAVEVADSYRRPGQTLQDYEILGEVFGEGPRCFAVRLSLGGPHEERKARYYILGLDPLWVLSQPDFEMLAHWEMNMNTERAPRPGRK